jgi:type I restriction enzyme S subunit
MKFKEVQLQDALDIQWGDTKTTKASYVTDGYLAYSATGPDGFLEKFDYDREGIVLSAIGANCGSTFYASGKWSSIKNTIRIFPKNDSIDLRYFYYMTKAPDFWPIRGSAQPFISQTDIRELYVQIPDISVQRAVGKILSQLEEKASANSVLSKTLEDIAKTIFESWFVDFDPVKAKMAGEEPVGIDKATAELFPNSMEDSELGLVPTGWNIKLLGDLVTPKKGKSITKATCIDGEVPVVAGGLQPAYFHNTANVLNPAITISASGANAGYVRMYLKDIWASDCSYINYEMTQTVFFWYLFLQRNQESIYGMQQGAAQPHIYPSDLMRLILCYPSTNELVIKFENLVAPLFQEIRLLELESKSIKNLRDSLLPRLVSGELEIPEEMLAS